MNAGIISQNSLNFMQVIWRKSRRKMPAQFFSPRLWFFQPLHTHICIIAHCTQNWQFF